MRKLKLQIQVTLDGFVARAGGQNDWIWLSGPAPEGGKVILELAESCDTLLMGRKMVPDFVKHWEYVVDHQPDNPQIALAQQMVNMRKIVFSRSETDIKGRNLKVENGDLVTVVKALKNEPGKDIMVYGGADFVSSLISADLIDEYYLLLNPVAIGKGLAIFKEQKLLKLESSNAYSNGKVLNKYLPV